MGVTFTFTILPASPAPPADTSASPGSDDGSNGFRDWALDPLTGDLMIGDDGDAVFNTGAAGIASDIQSRLRTWLGEWYLDTSLGFPWLQDVLGQRYDAALVRRDITNLCLGTPGAVVVQTYEAAFDNDTRELDVDFQVLCDTGEIIDASLNVTQGV